MSFFFNIATPTAAWTSWMRNIPPAGTHPRLPRCQTSVVDAYEPLWSVLQLREIAVRGLSRDLHTHTHTELKWVHCETCVCEWVSECVCLCVCLWCVCVVWVSECVLSAQCVVRVREWVRAMMCVCGVCVCVCVCVCAYRLSALCLWRVCCVTKTQMTAVRSSPLKQNNTSWVLH